MRKEKEKHSCKGILVAFTTTISGNFAMKY